MINQIAESSNTLSDPIERFVEADAVATFLCIERRRVLELARRGKLPAYPLGDGQRRQWRFRLSEVAEFVSSRGIKTSQPSVPERIH
jgi:excisionase family DNA binding protein